MPAETGSATSQVDTATQQVLEPIEPLATRLPIPALESPAPPPIDLWARLRMQFDWPQSDHVQVQRERQKYLRQINYLPVVTGRSALYLYYITGEVEARGLPLELALLPLVESTMDPFARSPDHAVGLWQIMPATGRQLGLASNWWYDGRQDLRDSTRAALDYLESLHRRFNGDWLLALAAYNSGKGRVGRAISNNRKHGKGTDYWSLRLPRETRQYVPKLLALASIVADPGRYDTSLPPLANEPAFAIAATGGQIELARAATLAGIDEALLRALNPGQLRWATAPEQPQELLLPPEALPRFEQGLASLAEGERVSWQHYRIQPGDSLSRIARHFNTGVALLREVNHIDGSLIRAGDSLLIPQGDAWSGSLALMGKGGVPRTHDYRVRRGDSLYRIAGRFNVSIQDIVSWNSLNPRAYLRPGQQLTLYLNRER
ncbi:MAG: LysM peptidoglycan-binding domain-containing protein [Parahaliea sp.]